MSNRSRLECPSAFVFYALALAAAILLAPSPARAQTHWLRYQMTVDSSDTGTQNNVYDSGMVQTTNLLTTNVFGVGTVATAHAAPSANYGQLQLTAICSVKNPAHDGRGHSSRFLAGSGGADVLFQDTLTVTSATLPAGTPVQIQIASAYGGSVTPGLTSSDPSDYTDSSASVGLDVFGNSQSAVISGVYGTNVISYTLPTFVGSNFYFLSSITANGSANNLDGATFTASITANITSQIYVNVLTPGADYTAASGTVYPGIQVTLPALSIQPISNGVQLVWPGSPTAYRLFQSPDLSTANWTGNLNVVNSTNGFNYVTIIPADGTLFFRLIKQ